jgi:Glycosyltransferase family 28 C-terminal domain
VIGYYIHHLGHGHLAMARCIAPRLAGGVTGLSSLARPQDWPGDWLTLPRDDTGEPAIEPTAHGQLHWAPLGHPGLRDRMAAIAGWIQRAAPSVIAVDVSVEVAALARLMGMPVVSVVLPGQRDDPAHRLGHTLAETLIGPWPAFLSRDLLGDDPVAARIQAVGAFSRFDGRAPELPAVRRGRSALVLQGSGGSAVTARQLREAAAATPEWEWTVLGGTAGSWVTDPWPLLCRADVVVTHGGMNAVAEVAAARKPAVVVPQARPHGEQQATGRALARAGLAVVTDGWPQAARWPAVLRSALELGGERWTAWSPGTGANDAAEIIESVGGRQPRGSEPCAVRS